LVQELLAGRLNGEAFSRAFFAERKEDLDKDLETCKKWPRRYDVELLEAHATGKLSDEEFDAQWHALLGYSADDPFIGFFEKLFSVVEAYEPDAEIFEMPGGEFDYYFHDESELRRQVRDLLTELERQEAHLCDKRLDTSKL
jgi:hypothetical protein